MRRRSSVCLLLLLTVALASAQTVSSRKLSGFEGYRQAHWFPDGEHLLLVGGTGQEVELTVTDRLGSLENRTRSSKRLPFYAANRVYVIDGYTLYSVGQDGIYATRPLPETYRAYTHASPDGRWLISLEGSLLDENFQEVLNIHESVGYDASEGEIAGVSWRDGSLFLVTHGRVNGQAVSHVLQVELATGSLTVLDASSTNDWDELADTFPDGDLLLRRREETTGLHIFQRCTVDLVCTTLPSLTDAGRFTDLALSHDGLYYGGLGFEPGDFHEVGAPRVEVGRTDGTWTEHLPVVADFSYEWSPTRNELVVIVSEPPGYVYPLVVGIQ